MINRLKSLTYFIIPLLVILWIVYINRFPNGYVYNSGDFSQPINLDKHFNELFYTWGDGISAPGEGGPFSWFAASPYYFAFYLVPTYLGLSDSQNLSFILFCFLSLSYISFYISQRLLFKKQEKVYEKLFPLLYSMNMTTLYFFTYTWGFSHHVFLYITFPIIISMFYLLLHELKLKYLIVYLLALAISAPGFTNPAFFVGLVFVLALFLLGLILLKNIHINKFLFHKIIIIIIMSLLSLSFWIVPTIPLISQNMSQISSGVFDLESWLRSQSSDMLSIIIGLPGYKGFPPFSHEQTVFYFLPFISVAVLAYLLSTISTNIKNSKVLKLVLALLLVEILLFILLKKAMPPFGQETLLLYRIPFLNTFRSYEKIAIFVPFINLISIYGLILFKNLNAKLITGVIILMILAPYPFLFGGIQTKYSITIGSDNSKDYKTATYSGLVKIPADYYDVANYLNEDDKLDTKIQSLPFSPLNTTAWVNFPKWKLIGLNITDYLFDKPILATNSSQYMLENWIPQAELNETKLNSIWYTRLLTYLNVSHIIYHYDVDDRFVFQSFPKIRSLEKSNNIEALYTTNYLTLYKLPNTNVLPKFYIPEKLILTKNDVADFPYLLTQDNYQNKSLFVFSKSEMFTNASVNLETEPVYILSNISENEKPDFCTKICFKLENPMNDKHELRVSLEGFNINEIQDLSVSIYEINKDLVEKETLGVSELEIMGSGNDYINLGEYVFKNENVYYISIDYKQFANLINTSDTWVPSGVFKNDQEIVYKTIRDCKSDMIYQYINLSDKQKLSEFIVTENAPDFENPQQNQENPTLVEFVLVRGYENTSFTPKYSIDNTCNIYILKEDIDSFKNIEIKLVYDPKLILRRSTVGISSQVELPTIESEKINPTKYKLLVSKTSSPYFLVFNESYNDEWGLFKKEWTKKIEISKDTHFVSNGFSNGWIINPSEITSSGEYELIVKYKPQRYFILGIVLSISTMLTMAIVILVRKYLTRKNEI